MEKLVKVGRGGYININNVKTILILSDNGEKETPHTILIDGESFTFISDDELIAFVKALGVEDI